MILVIFCGSVNVFVVVGRGTWRSFPDLLATFDVKKNDLCHACNTTVSRVPPTESLTNYRGNDNFRAKMQMLPRKT